MECRCQAATCRLCSLKRTCRELRQRLREGERPLARAARKAHRVSWPCGLSPKQRHQVLCTYVLSGHNAMVAMQHARQLQRRAASDDTLPSITFVQNLYREAAAADVDACTDPQTAAQKQQRPTFFAGFGSRTFVVTRLRPRRRPSSSFDEDWVIMLAAGLPQTVAAGSGCSDGVNVGMWVEEPCQCVWLWSLRACPRRLGSIFF